MPPTGQVTMSEDRQVFAHFANSMFHSLSQVLHRIASAFFPITEALRKVCLRIYHLPGRILTALNHAPSISVTALLSVLNLTGWRIATNVLLIALFYTGRFGLRLWRVYMRRWAQTRSESRYLDSATHAQRLLAGERARRPVQQHDAGQRKRRQGDAVEHAAREQAILFAKEGFQIRKDLVE